MSNQEVPVKKNDVVEVEFRDLSHDGAGVAKIDGYTLFVPYGIPGETANVKVIKTKKGYGFGKILDVKVESEDRNTPPCPIFY
ncbi:TRAM domain-containing protein, partial [Staphylococcus sp. SIMBA_130]